MTPSDVAGFSLRSSACPPPHTLTYGAAASTYVRSSGVTVGVAAVLLVVALSPALGTATTPGFDDPGARAPDDATNVSQAELVAVYPNPTADGDAGEYVVVDVPAGTDASGWTLVDDEGTVAQLPDRTISGRTVLSPEPDAVPGRVGGPVLPLAGRLRLANGGDVVELRRPNGSVVAAASYERAPEGELYSRRDGGWTWRVPGSTSWDPVSTTPASARAFVLPDAPGVVEEELRSADDRILLAGYTLTSERVTAALLDAHRRGVEVRVLLEGSPVGGTSHRQADALDRLSAAGITASVFAGDRDPFGVYHAKYAVVDDRALVLTENFKPAGTGGHSSRGWGVVLDGAQTASELARVFRADRTGPGVVSWEGHRSAVDPVARGASGGRYPMHFAPEALPVERARLLVAPDNALDEVAALIRSANDSIRIQQMAIEGIDDPLLQASIDAARNGTEVEILLSGASYVKSDNRELVREIDLLAAREDLPISASIVDPRGRFSKVHAKVAIVDDKHVVLGSLNWNPAAYQENREVVVVLTGEEIAGYYGAVYDADAREHPVWELPRSLAAAVCVLWLVLGLLAIARIRWAA
jgi:cardiolipin synthase